MSYIGNNPKVNTLTQKPQSVEPANPVEGMVYYDDGTNRSEGLYVYKNSVWTPVGQSASAGFNYIENGNAELQTNDWTIYKNSTAGVRPDDFGGTPSGNLTFVRSEVSPLVETASWLVSKTAANLQGEGAFYEFTAEEGHKTLNLLLSLLSDTSNVNIADGDLAIYLVGSNDNFSSDFLVIEPNNPDIIAGVPKILKQLQLNADKSKYRLCIHIKSTNATAYDVKLDDIQFGPKTVASSAIVTDWKSYIPSNTQGIGTISSISLEYRRVGSNLEVRGNFNTGTPTGSEAQLELPDSLTISGGGGTEIAGVWTLDAAGGGTQNDFRVLASNGDSYLNFGVAQDSTYAGMQIRNGNEIFNATTKVGIFTSVKIQGWESNAQSSEDLGARAITVRGASNGGESITATATNIPFIEVEDGTSSWNGSEFEAKETASYIITGQVDFTTSNGRIIDTFIDVGSGYAVDKRISDFITSTTHEFSAVIKLNKGDKLALRTDQNGGTLAVSSQSHWLHIEKIAQPQTILETELVAARMVNTNAQVISNNTSTTILYNTIQNDTHAGFNTVNGAYTVKTSGWYSISAICTAEVGTDSTEQTVSQLRVDNITVKEDIREYSSTNSNNLITFSIEESAIFLSKDSKISFVISQNSGNSITLDTTSARNTLSIAKLK